MERDHDHVATAAQSFCIIGTMFLVGSRHEGAAVQPNHNWTLLVVVHSWRPKIHAQAVLTLNPVVVAEKPGFFIVVPGPAWTLRTDSTVLHGAANPGPWFGFLRRLKAPASFRRLTVGNAFVDEDSVPDIAPDLSSGGFGNRVLVGRDNREFAGRSGLTGIFLRRSGLGNGCHQAGSSGCSQQGCGPP